MNALSSDRSIALDLGSTTLAGRLVDSAGAVLAAAQVANPQCCHGADILLRLQRAHAGEAEQLQSLVIDGLRCLVRQLLDVAGCESGDIVSAAAAGNPGLTCLLLQLPVTDVLFPPHKPPFRELSSIPVNTIDLGLSVPLELFPPVSGFVGGDLAACLLALRASAPGTLLIDIGTNAELALWDGQRWWVTSAAAGPAFEGGNISSGMTLAAGAVTDVQRHGDRLQLTVAGNGEALGLCGSGLAALVAAARQGGLIDASGRILSADEVETNLVRYLVRHEGIWAIRYYRSAVAELLLTQADLRNFQVAKGAVRAGVQVLLDRGGFQPDHVPQVVLTGALGTALPVAALKMVALLPEPMLDKTSLVANGVLAGLQAYLNAINGRQKLAGLIASMQPFPLSGTPAFERHFLASLEF